MKDKGKIRIGKFLSTAGIIPRRKVPEFLEKNQVIYQGKRIQDLNFYLPKEAVIWVNGKRVSLPKERIILLLHKPIGYVCSHRERRGEKSIFRLLPKEYRHFFFAGRLDKDSRGLVLLSNDGDLIYSLIHPRSEVIKKYLVRVQRPLSEKEEKRLLQGVYWGKEKLTFSSLIRKKPALYEIHLKEGKKRHIRRAFQKIGVEVKDLFRFQIGPYSIGEIPEGKFIVIKEDREG